MEAILKDIISCSIVYKYKGEIILWLSFKPRHNFVGHIKMQFVSFMKHKVIQLFFKATALSLCIFMCLRLHYTFYLSVSARH